MDSTQDIAGRLLRLRRALGYEQATEWCRFVGITDQAWNNFERARRRITIDEALRVAAKTGASLDWIYRGLEHTLPKHVADKLSKIPDPTIRPVVSRRAVNS